MHATRQAPKQTLQNYISIVPPATNCSKAEKIVNMHVAEQ